MERHLSLALGKFTFQEEKIEFQEEKIKSQEEKIKSQEEKIKSQEDKIKELEDKNKSQDVQLAQILQRLDQVENNQGSPSTPFTDTYVWKVANFSKRLQQAQYNFYYKLEKCFYTSRGHKLKIMLFPDQNEHVGIYFATTEGNFDDTIQWPMKAKIRFCTTNTNGEDVLQMFINTNNNSPGVQNSFQKPPHNENGRGTANFIPVNQVPLQDNTLTVKVKVSY